MLVNTVNQPRGMKLLRRLEVTRAEFEKPVERPFGDTISLADEKAREWLCGDQGTLLNGQSLQRQAKEHLQHYGQSLQVEEGPTGEGYRDAGGRSHACFSRLEQRIVESENESLFVRQTFEGYDHNLDPQYRTEVRCNHARGTVVILEYGPQILSRV